MASYYRYGTNYYKQDEKMTVLVDALNLSISKVKPIKAEDVSKTPFFTTITQTDFEEKQESVKSQLGINSTQKLINRQYAQVSRSV